MQNFPSLQLRKVGVEDTQIWCDVSTGVLRPLIPAEHRRAVFEHMHSLAHAGTHATTRLVSNRFVWHRMAADIKEWCQQCVACQQSKVTRHQKSTPESIIIPQISFLHVHVDLVGPWPTTCAGYRNMLTMLDRSARWWKWFR